MKNHLIVFIALCSMGSSLMAITNPALAPDDSVETFSLRLHHDNYVLIGKFAEQVNLNPFLPYLWLVPNTDLSKTEVAFQISLKMKTINNILGSPLDLWGGYTQQTYWQAYNGKSSRPVRETNYNPEFYVVLPLDFSLLGLSVRHASLGVEHQSNGQLVLFSRSWNRIDGELGFQTGNLSLVGRFWTRFGEMAENVDIYDYMGYGHITATYRWRGHIFSALVRRNLRTDRGAVQLSWASPIHPNIKGYVQLFSGYGQSLIDYNVVQKSIGVGLMVDSW